MTILTHWGHLRLTPEEYHTIKQLTDNRIKDTWEWVEIALNRISLREFRQLLKEVGLEPVIWNNRIDHCRKFSMALLGNS